MQLKLYKGNVRWWAGLRPFSLYSESLVTFEDDKGAYDQKDAAGFIKLNTAGCGSLRCASGKVENDRMSGFANWPPRNPRSTVTLAREMAAHGQATLAPPPFPEDAVLGDGQPAIVIPGFLAPDMSTARLRDFLTRQNFSLFLDRRHQSWTWPR